MAVPSSLSQRCSLEAWPFKASGFLVFLCSPRPSSFRVLFYFTWLTFINAAELQKVIKIWLKVRLLTFFCLPKRGNDGCLSLTAKQQEVENIIGSS